MHEEQIPVIRERLANYYMRHPWDIVAPFLPELQVEPIWLELGKKQRDRYAEIANGEVITDYLFQDLGRRVDRKEVTAGVRLHYLMRCVDGLKSLPEQKYRDSVKRNKAMDLLTGEMGGEPTVVFSRFLQPLDELEKELDDALIPYARIDGQRDDDANTAARIAFTNGEARVLLMTGKGGYALNLQVARYGIAYNTLYNPAKLNQLYGRIRRPGTHSHVLWYHLLTRDTVEEAQWVTIREREGLSKEIFGLHEELFNTLTPAEQEELIHYGHGRPR